MSSSNVSGSSNLLDLQTLVSNLQSSVNNISSAFSTVQSNISNLNIYDSLNTQKVNQINILDGEQEQEIEVLKQENLSDDQRLDIIEAKINPVSNAIILNESISKVKILNLTDDLLTINTSITTANNRITDLNTLHVNDVNTLTLNLNNQITKQATDNTNINNSFNTLLSSVPGSQNTFQQQIDIIKSHQLTDEGDINVLKSSVSNLQGDNTSNKNRIGLLESDNSVNKSNISSLQSNLTTANNNITTNTANISTLNTNLTSQINKEASDVANLQSQINSLSTTSSNGNSTLQSQITVISNKQTTDYNDLQGQITTNKNIQIADKSELNSKISDNLTTETNHFNALNTSLNNLTTKQDNDNSVLQSNLTTYIGSNNTRNITNETDISNLKTNVNTNSLDISSLKTDNATNKNNISLLQSKTSVLEADNSTSKANITTNTNDIATINSKINVAESSITNLLQDVSACKSYDLTNTTNINNITNNIANNTSEINTLKNTTIVNLDNKFLIKNDPLITENILGKLKVDNLDSINGTLTVGENSTVINIGSVSNNDAKVINIGGANDIVCILGSLQNIQTTNTSIKDKLITLNDGSVGNNQASLVGFQIRDDDNNNKGYIITNSTGNEFILKPPQNDNEFKIGNVDTFTSLTTKLYVDLQTSALQTSINGLINTSTELNNQITTLNTTQLDNIPYSKLNAFPSTINFVQLGNGSFGKVNNNVIDNNTINPLKLTGSDGDVNKYLSADGSYKSIPTGNFTSTTKVVNTNFDDNTINSSKLLNYPSNGNKYLSGDGSWKTTTDLLGNLNANNLKIINLGDAVNPTEAVNLQTMNNMLSTYYYTKDDTHNYLWANYYNTFQINNRIINPDKILDYPSDGTKYLSGDGTWKVVSGGSGSSFDSSTLRLNNISSSADVSINNYKLTNVANPTSSNDAVNKSYVDNKYGETLLYTQTISTYQGETIATPILNVFSKMDLKNNPIVNVLDPENPQEVSTKNYVDNSLTYNLSSPVVNSLSGISCKILIVSNDGNNTNPSLILNKLNNVITSLGGSTTDIVINIFNYGSGVNILSYNSNYDVVLYWHNGTQTSRGSNVATVLNQYYNDGKGVIVGLFGMSSNSSTPLSLTKNISSANTETTANTSYLQSSSNIILSNVSNMYIGGSVMNMTSLSGSIGIGSIGSNNNNVLYYLADTTYGNRIDLNFYPSLSINGDSTTTGTTRTVLQACLWAAKKIPVTSSTKLNLTNPILPKLQVYNTPSTDYDVVNKLYLSNNYTKYFKSLTTTDFFVYIDLTKPHTLSLSYISGTLSMNSIATLFLYPLWNNYLCFKIFYGETGWANAQSLVLNNGATSGPWSTCFSSISLVNGVLKIVPTTNGLQVYDM